MENTTAAATLLLLSITYEVEIVALSIAISFIGAWSAVNSMARFQYETDPRSRAILLVEFGILIGGVSIWTMHFLGMSALNLSLVTPDGLSVPYEERYLLWKTIVSLVSAIVFIIIGGWVASTDPFFGASKVECITALQKLVKLQSIVNRTNIKFVALFTKPQRIILGGVIAGGGVCIMHFVGMAAMLPLGFHIEWNIGIIALACVTACTVATVGFWIVFRFLQWRHNSEIFRLLSAIVIAAAVCVTHYTGMFAAAYVWDGKSVQQDLSGSEAGTSAPDLMLFGMIFSIAIVLLSMSKGLTMMRQELHFTRIEVTSGLIKVLQEQVQRARSLDELTQLLDEKIVLPFEAELNSKGGTRKSKTNQAASTVIVQKTFASHIVRDGHKNESCEDSYYN